ncbi:hypothetical protein BS78_06G129000 [Paspalum vaginatum]|nr:hypothetical protein BS78_06G129000 [Paspalum vaginatum]KAJ1271439.1 hypothetical protein BS78_06G129000 [Paspalum vaginatum]
MRSPSLRFFLTWLPPVGAPAAGSGARCCVHSAAVLAVLCLQRSGWTAALLLRGLRLALQEQARPEVPCRPLPGRAAVVRWGAAPARIRPSSSGARRRPARGNVSGALPPGRRRVGAVAPLVQLPRCAGSSWFTRALLSATRAPALCSIGVSTASTSHGSSRRHVVHRATEPAPPSACCVLPLPTAAATPAPPHISVTTCSAPPLTYKIVAQSTSEGAHRVALQHPMAFKHMVSHHLQKSNGEQREKMVATERHQVDKRVKWIIELKNKVCAAGDKNFMVINHQRKFFWR